METELKAWDEVLAVMLAPAVLALDPTGHVANLYSKKSFFCSWSFYTK